MNAIHRSRAARSLALASALAAALAITIQCRSTSGATSGRAGATDWDVVYDVLQHPRCVNCHPAGDVPLQGDELLPHAQNVQRGPQGTGLFALRCATCHQTRNTPGPHMPPGAPNWHLPHPDAPLVFEGRSRAELCRQLRDPAQNGNRTPEQILAHVAEDPLVLWGWSPGDGRAPVPIAHDVFVAAVRRWVAGGCDCP